MHYNPLSTPAHTLHIYGYTHRYTWLCTRVAIHVLLCKRVATHAQDNVIITQHDFLRAKIPSCCLPVFKNAFSYTMQKKHVKKVLELYNFVSIEQDVRRQNSSLFRTYYYMRTRGTKA